MPYRGDFECRRKMCQSHNRAKYRSRSPGQGICRVSTSRRSTGQGLVVVGHIVEEISNVDVKCVKVTAVRNIWVKVTGSKNLPSQYITMQGLVVVGLIFE